MINVVKDSGFCHGVSAAVHKAQESLAQSGKVYLCGDLVNNRQVMARFTEEGFIVVSSAEEIEAGSSVVIRAHGVGRGVYEALEAKNADIIDCTCVKVKQIHKIVSEKSAEGFRVIIVGKKNHPEVMGILGWCERGEVIESESELTDLTSPICVVAQTTCNKLLWEKVVANIKKKLPEAEIFDTLCDVTTKRIENAEEMAKECDAMVVVGDKKSANSVELYEACKDVCKNIFFASSLEELLENIDPPIEVCHANSNHPPKRGDCDTSEAERNNWCRNKLERYEKIGIAGSASAPIETIEKIRDFLSFAKFLEQSKTEIDMVCDSILDEESEARKNHVIKEAINDLINQNKNGKRVRGAMIKLGYAVAKDSMIPQSIIQIAAAYEIFQTAILIHDDVLDKSVTRRGKPTIHAVQEDAHFGISRAICIGDYALFLSNKILASSGLESEILVKVIEFFSKIQLRTLEGEIVDVSLPYFPINIVQDYDEYMRTVLEIYEYKTAWYTLAGPFMLGAICGGASEELLDALREIALPLGIAFQIKDDLLGIYASEKVLGKPALSDIIEKKQTILYGYALKHASPEQNAHLEKIYGNPKANEDDLKVIRDIFEKTGAKSYAESEIERFSQNALNEIENKLTPRHHKLLRGLVYYLLTRRY
ncbi:MAG: 4-hydroxy-3-methylbut-2-enyl diphosphate reductase [Defluviitaleaceae bacterium]|nr:4-hydroxy-3-methylbut-2-enyl diphosphate reductase [Defluviitaleaceae bacterium]